MDYSRALPRRANRRPMDESLLSEIVFLGVVVIWGVTFVFSRDALAVVGPFAYNTLRMFLGVFILALLTGRQWRFASQADVWPALITGLVLFAAYAMQAYGQQFTTASKAGFLTGTNLIYVPLFSAVILRRAPHRMALLGVVLAFTGLILMSAEGGLGNLRLGAGDTWLAVSGVSWGLYFILLARYSPQRNVMVFATLHVLVAAILSGVGWLWVEPLTIPASSTALWVGVITTGGLVIGFGTSVQTWVTRLASPTRVALIAAMEPVFAALAGWWVGETLTLQVMAGGLLIVLGMVVAELTHLERQPALVS